MSIEASFLKFSADKLRQLAGRIGACLDKLTLEQVWARHSENENAVGNLALHLAGNVRQWIGSGIAGNPDVRMRDREFAARGDISPVELKERLLATVSDAAAVIGNLPTARLPEVITVQGYTVTVMEAIYHVVEHFAGHTGQIVFATKFLTGEDLGFYKHLKAPTHQEHTP